MDYLEKLQKIDELQTLIKGHGTLPQEILKKINYKLRLEWNFTSNSMEGNTLTRRETRTVMVGLVGVNDKPIKDVMEMRKHDSVITTIMKIGAGELNVSEKRIKEIHRGIMYEENPELLKQIGEWKNTNNYLINFKGERFDFTPATEVKEKIHQLTDWLSAQNEKHQRNDRDGLHPAILAFQFHLDYLTIHPFYDGNGRTARILSNLILISYGFPPIFIKEEEKSAYYQYLTDIQSYGGDPYLFYEFMEGLLLRSQQLIIDAIEGQDIDEPEDYLKELELVKRKLANEQIPKSPKVVYDTFLEVEKSVWKPVLLALGAFTEIFNESRETNEVNGLPQVFQTEKRNIFTPFIVEKSTAPTPKTIFGYNIYEEDITEVSWKQKKYGLKGASQAVDFEIVLRINFTLNNYSLSLEASGKSGDSMLMTQVHAVKKRYYEPWTEEEINTIKTILGKHLVVAIQSYLDNDHLC